MKKWHILNAFTFQNIPIDAENFIGESLTNRSIKTPSERSLFLSPAHPDILTPEDVGIHESSLKKALARIKKAVSGRESIVVYADYDADGITAGAILWETLYSLGARVMPYIPHRQEEGYGLSKMGIDRVREQFDPSLVITVDHGITAKEKVAYAKKLGIDTIVTDHHVKPKTLPDCTIVHTTQLSGSGVSWFLAKELLKSTKKGSGFDQKKLDSMRSELVALAAIGTIADMVSLVGPNRSIAKFGLSAINRTTRVGLTALMADAGVTRGELGTYDVSHLLAPRLNAAGRIEHALDALRLLCTKNEGKATLLAQQLGLTNRERQRLTEETVMHARDLVTDPGAKLLFVSHASYNPGVIGLVAGKLVEEFYRPAIVLSLGDGFAKASARSVSGFNIVEAIRSCSDILVDVGGHPMAAGFTVETKHVAQLRERLLQLADRDLDSEKLTRMVKIDLEIPLDIVTEEVWKKIKAFEPFGFGNPEPVFATRSIRVDEARLVGKEGKHLKLRLASPVSKRPFDAIAFGFGHLVSGLAPGTLIDIAYSIDQNVWNGNKKLQLKIKDIQK